MLGLIIERSRSEWTNEMPHKDEVHCTGLYQREEHDACGVGFVAEIGQPPSHRVIEQGLECLASLTHRGAVDADGSSGYGAGVMCEFACALVAREASRLIPAVNVHWTIAVGVVCRPPAACERALAL